MGMGMGRMKLRKMRTMMSGNRGRLILNCWHGNDSDRKSAQTRFSLRGGGVAFGGMMRLDEELVEDQKIN